jgi:DNA-binding response OmpR family regulator
MSGRAMKRQRILVVEDCRELAFAWGRLIKQWGHDVSVVSDAFAAIRAAASAPFDAAILDLDLPVMDGFELAMRLLRQPGHECLLLIAVTGRPEEESRRYAAEIGFHHYLTKPVSGRELQVLLRPETPAVAG